MSSSPSSEINWQQLILDHKNSGQTMADFCRDRGLRFHQFYHYQRKLSGKKKAKSSFSKVKVVIPPPTKKAESRVVIYFNDLSIALEGHQDLDVIASLCFKLGQS